MSSHIRMIHTEILSPSSSVVQFTLKPITNCRSNNHQKKKTISRSPGTLSSVVFRSNFKLFHSFLVRSDHNFKSTRAMKSDDLVGEKDEDDELVIEPCLTRMLPPALTFKHGLEALLQAIEDLKLNPPSATSGIIRIEVAVPPSAKALDWFCSQPETSEIFPQFYMSKEFDKSTDGPAPTEETRGVFGIGAAVCFARNTTCDGDDDFELWKSIRRYLLVDSPNSTAYGFFGVNYDNKSSYMTNETGSFYFLIPQIELNEDQGFSLLAATMAWGETSVCSFEEALHCCQACLLQASHEVSFTKQVFSRAVTWHSMKKFNAIEEATVQAVFINAPSIVVGNDIAASVEMLKNSASAHQFCIRLSPATAIAANMLDFNGDFGFLPGDCLNINTVWASLIVEECFRLGLTYFCVAPGSRSSLLAVAAATHPHVTCISCFDERSLAFHAVGYARGSRRPAVVITTSGTAVSNLYPAVVEASQDFVPLVLLTADRPPELHETGANQAINQVNHFGSYVRFFFNLPVPTDHVVARMVLTTVDSAVYWATRSPQGPVHINCLFREPLENSFRKWNKSCLERLDFWISSAEPFTKYIPVQYSNSCVHSGGLMVEIHNLIKKAERGLLLVGSTHTEDDIWAAFMLARHLLWPVVADILSGLRLRRLLASYPEYVESLVFIDHFDHLLLSDAVDEWAQADAIIQIGSRLTSKRISQMLTKSFPCSYVMVDEHPYRHDPSHIVTHRVQCTISQFAASVMQISFPRLNSHWTGFLQALDEAVAWEISFQIDSKYSLTEPYVARLISRVVSSDTAIFIGNSMAIRDADMYSCGLLNHSATSSQSTLICEGIQVAGNRGASGIDGLLSTAVGFALGCKKRVLCVLGDISLLHDTNGLSILSTKLQRKPMTVLVINNHGGAIFGFLPIAERTERRILDDFFYYTHKISISKLCAAHGVKHITVETKTQLQEALLTSQQDDSDWVIEVESSVDSNSLFHSVLRESATKTVAQAFGMLSRFPVLESVAPNFFFCKVIRMEYSLYRLGLHSPPTSVSSDSGPTKWYRHGFILALYFDNGTVGYGEVAPLVYLEEDLLEVEEQLLFILHSIKGAEVGHLLPLFKGSFSSWIWRCLGVPPCSIFPSVRCGLEMALLNAIAKTQNSSFHNTLQSSGSEELSQQPSSIQICALIDHKGSPVEVAHVAYMLVQQGFCAIKLKVARRLDPKEDAAVVQEVRKKVGPLIELRVDANRKWTFEQATEFGSHVSDCGLQYIEEPVKDEDDILKFCEETGLPVALDETFDNFEGNLLELMARFRHPGIVAFVIKPTFVGGFENATLIARWAHLHGKIAVVSAAFESSLSLSNYVQLALHIELHYAELGGAADKITTSTVAHGLGTYQWLEEDVSCDPLKIIQDSDGGVKANAIDAGQFLRNFIIDDSIIVRNSTEDQVRMYQLNVESDISNTIEVLEIGESSNNNVLVFLHGFLGSGQEWIPIMKALSRSAKCISIDLPGHGNSKVQCHVSEDAAELPRLSVASVSDLIFKLLKTITPGEVTLVGYSMGARIALYMALRSSSLIKGAIIISGSPGLRDMTGRKIRAAIDDSKARSIIAFGLRCFLQTWYAGEMWQSFREHPHFKGLVSKRSQKQDIHGLAEVLSGLSVGRQPSLWEDLKDCKTELLFVVGEKDVKFKRIMQDIFHETGHDGHGTDRQDNRLEGIEVPNCGHAVHLENPLAVVSLVGKFLSKMRKRST